MLKKKEVTVNKIHTYICIILVSVSKRNTKNQAGF